MGTHIPKRAPQILDQSGGDKVCGPDQNDPFNRDRIVELIKSISSQNVSAQVKFEVIQRAVATCPKMNMGCERKRTLSLLATGSQVSSICQSYFEWEILPHITPSSREKGEVNQLFQLTAASNEALPFPCMWN